LGHAAQLHDSLCQQVHVALGIAIDVVKELVQRHEAGTFDIPMRLLGLQHEVDALTETLLEDSGHLEADFFGQTVAGVSEFEFHHRHPSGSRCEAAMG
jgi:hypothetical protein